MRFLKFLIPMLLLQGCDPVPGKRIRFHLQERNSTIPCFPERMQLSIGGIGPVSLSCTPPDAGSACARCLHGEVSLPPGEWPLEVTIGGWEAEIGPDQMIRVTESGDMGPGVERDLYLWVAP